jgi:hypothetical protein
MKISEFDLIDIVFACRIWCCSVDDLMILAEKSGIDKNRDDSAQEWYPGKYVGLPEPGRGEWLV